MSKQPEKTGVELIAEERQEQLNKHGRTIESDVSININGQLMDAVKQLIRGDNERDPLEKAFKSRGFTPPLNWDVNIFGKMIGKPYKERLIIAGALIAAEIDRLQNLKS